MAVSPQSIQPVPRASTRSRPGRTRSCARRVDTSALPPLTRAVVERVIHASADLDYLGDVQISSEADLEKAREALAAGCAVVDRRSHGRRRHHERDGRLPGARRRRPPRASPAARPGSGGRMREVGPGAVWVIGNAPTALEELLTLDADPALVVGLPVGFVGAVESKAALRAAGLPAISNVSEKGGSAVAAAAVNALLYATAA